MKIVILILFISYSFNQSIIETREFEIYYDGSGAATFDLYENFNLTSEIYYLKLISISEESCNDEAWEIYLDALGQHRYGNSSTCYDGTQLEWGQYGSIYWEHGFAPDGMGSWFESFIPLSNNNLDCYESDGKLRIIANQCPFTAKIWIMGNFNDNEGEVEGDLNNDNEINILDIIILVDIILNNGSGNIYNLINSVID